MASVNSYSKLCILAFILFGPILFIQGCSNGDGREVIRIGHPVPEDHPLHKALMEIEPYLAEQQVDDIEVRIYPNGQLGSAADHIQMISSGQIQAGVFSASPVSSVIPMMNAFSLPFLFRDTDHKRRVLEGELGKEVLGYLDEQNMFGFGYFTAGSRNIMSKNPVLKPDDLSGMNIRVMESNILVQIIRAMGGSAVVMGASDVYSALQQGVLDGWENNPPTAYFFRMYETGTNHFSWTRHLIIPDVILASNSLKEQLSEEQFLVVEEAFNHAIETQWREWETFTEESITKLKDAGMEFHKVDEGAFQERVEGIYDRAFERYGEEFQSLVERIQNTQ